MYDAPHELRSASATRASAASTSPLASWRSTLPPPACTPRRVIPVVLDMGTDNLRLLNNEMYIGNRHARVRDQRYDDLIDAYVTAAAKLFPHAMSHGRTSAPATPAAS